MKMIRPRPLLLNCGIHNHQSAPLESSCCIDILKYFARCRRHCFADFWAFIFFIASYSFFLYLFRKDTLVHICKHKTLAQDWNLTDSAMQLQGVQRPGKPCCLPKRGLCCRPVSVCVCLSVCLSVRPSARPSVTFVYCIQRAEDIGKNNRKSCIDGRAGLF